MLDSNFIRENPDRVREATRNKGLDSNLVDKWLELDKQWRELTQQVEDLRQQRNALVKEFKDLGQKPPEDKIKQGRKLKAKLQELETKLKKIEQDRQEAGFLIPNLPADDVPVGKDESKNKVIRKEGESTKFDFKPKDHLMIGEALDIIDVKRAAKVSGSRFGYFKGDGALLEMALMQYVFLKLVNKNFVPIIPPVITKKKIERGLGYAEHGGWDQAYVFEKDNIVFNSSSEHAVIPLHTGEVLNKEDLPIKYVNFSTCFRREAGTYGKDTRGIFRVHQFNKVEMNVYTVPDVKVSDQVCLDLLALQEEIMQDLKLPYRVVQNCTGDLPFPNRRMYDIETWFPGQNQYRETQSCSNCTDFQTRRLNIKVKTKQGSAFVHALNATAITDRAVIAILENYQQIDGSILVPDVLQGSLGKDRIGC